MCQSLESLGNMGQQFREQKGYADGYTTNTISTRQSYKPFWETADHSGSGKSYCPVRIRFFIPGDIGAPQLL
jgi:hypothetical protein